jgi:hypothetical protein
MRNYMTHCITTKSWTLKYYDPMDKKYITADHVARFFGCQLARSLHGNPSIERCWSMWESLDAIGTCMIRMLKNAFRTGTAASILTMIGMLRRATSGTRDTATKE